MVYRHPLSSIQHPLEDPGSYLVAWICWHFSSPHAIAKWTNFPKSKTFWWVDAFEFWPRKKKTLSSKPISLKRISVTKNVGQDLGFHGMAHVFDTFFHPSELKRSPNQKSITEYTPTKPKQNPAPIFVHRKFFPAKDLILGSSDITRQSTVATNASSPLWAQHLLQGPLDPQRIFGERLKFRDKKCWN